MIKFLMLSSVKYERGINFLCWRSAAQIMKIEKLQPTQRQRVSLNYSHFL